jgi:hypothetical protein
MDNNILIVLTVLAVPVGLWLTRIIVDWGDRVTGRKK